MCSISMSIDTRELGNACKNCDSCKHSDYLEDGMMVCLVHHKDVFMTSPCHICHLWKGKL